MTSFFALFSILNVMRLIDTTPNTTTEPISAIKPVSAILVRKNDDNNISPVNAVNISAAPAALAIRL